MYLIRIFTYMIIWVPCVNFPKAYGLLDVIRLMTEFNFRAMYLTLIQRIVKLLVLCPPIIYKILALDNILT